MLFRSVSCIEPGALTALNSDSEVLSSSSEPAVIEFAGNRYAMSCFAALFDPEARQVTYATAGHPFPYVCRAAATPGATELGSLVARGVPLGVSTPNQVTESKPGMPFSAMVGMAGAAALRLALLMATARNRPEAT